MEYTNLQTLHGLLWEYRIFKEEFAYDEDLISRIADISITLENDMRRIYQEEHDNED